MSRYKKKSHYFQAGVSKLNEAKQLVDELKRKAAEQSQLLAEKQSEADQALGQITESMQVCGTGGTKQRNKSIYLFVFTCLPLII